MERSIIVYGLDGNVTESSTRHPTRLAGIGRWRPFEDGRFEAFFEKFAFPVHEQKPAAWVRVKFTVRLNDPATEYAGDATGLFMTMNREILDAVPTHLTAKQWPWRLSDNGRISSRQSGSGPAGAAAENGAAKITSGHRQQ